MTRAKRGAKVAVPYYPTEPPAMTEDPLPWLTAEWLRDGAFSDEATKGMLALAGTVGSEAHGYVSDADRKRLGYALDSALGALRSTVAGLQDSGDPYTVRLGHPGGTASTTWSSRTVEIGSGPMIDPTLNGPQRAAIMAGLTFHEIGHVRLTRLVNPKLETAWRGRGVSGSEWAKVRTVSNIIEDVRTESIDRAYFPGMAQTLDTAMRWVSDRTVASKAPGTFPKRPDLRTRNGRLEFVGAALRYPWLADFAGIEDEREWLATLAGEAVVAPTVKRVVEIITEVGEWVLSAPGIEPEADEPEPEPEDEPTDEDESIEDEAEADDSEAPEADEDEAVDTEGETEPEDTDEDEDEPKPEGTGDDDSPFEGTGEDEDSEDEGDEPDDDEDESGDPDEIGDDEDPYGEDEGDDSDEDEPEDDDEPWGESDTPEDEDPDGEAPENEGDGDESEDEGDEDGEGDPGEGDEDGDEDESPYDSDPYDEDPYGDSDGDEDEDEAEDGSEADDGSEDGSEDGEDGDTEDGDSEGGSEAGPGAEGDTEGDEPDVPLDCLGDEARTNSALDAIAQTLADYAHTVARKADRQRRYPGTRPGDPVVLVREREIMSTVEIGAESRALDRVGWVETEGEEPEGEDPFAKAEAARQLRELRSDEAAVRDARGIVAKRVPYATTDRTDAGAAIAAAISAARRGRQAPERGCRSGRLDRGRLARVVQGNQRVFIKDQAASPQRVRAYILLDASASMSGTKTRNTGQLARDLAVAFDSISWLDAKVYAHTTDGVGPYVTPLWAKGEDRALVEGYFSIPQSGNWDGYAIAFVADDLIEDTKRGEKQLLVVISDGEPYGPPDYREGFSHTKTTVEFYRQRGVRVVSVSIDGALGAEKQRQLYGDDVVEYDPNPAALARNLARVIGSNI